MKTLWTVIAGLVIGSVMVLVHHTKKSNNLNVTNIKKSMSHVSDKCGRTLRNGRRRNSCGNFIEEKD